MLNRLKLVIKISKFFAALLSYLSVLHNHFDGPTKLFSNLYLVLLLLWRLRKNIKNREIIIRSLIFYVSKDPKSTKKEKVQKEIRLLCFKKIEIKNT